MQRSDGWMWSFTRHGNYFVRSGYHCVMNMQSRDVPGSSYVAFGGNKIWDLNILSKIKFFTWSAYCNVLPTKENLQKKAVQVDLQCPVCGYDIELVVHCLLFCSVACAVWHGRPLNLRVSEFPFGSFVDFFDIMSTDLEREQLELLCTLSRKIPCGRNDAQWNSRRIQPQQIIEGAMKYLGEHKRAQESLGRGSAVVQWHSETRWHPPDEGTIKINVDGAIAEQRQVFSMGAVARDHHGNVLAAMACQGKDVVVAEFAEAHSVRHALRWANEHNLGKIIIETDCASIVTALLSDIALNSELGNILSDCKSMMASFPYCHVQHTR
ncbi:hypothetical protein SLE2022_265880 [Rubroshorea leprosula]